MDPQNKHMENAELMADAIDSIGIDHEVPLDIEPGEHEQELRFSDHGQDPYPYDMLGQLDDVF